MLPRRHAVTVSGRPDMRCTETLDQCPVLYSRALKSPSEAAWDLGNSFSSRAQPES